MPIFRYMEPGKPTQYALVSYKGLYSLFKSSGSWQFIDSYANPRLLLHALLRERGFQTWLVVRNPYKRIVSCFKDKYRKQPTRIHEPNFVWQDCHDIVFEREQVSQSASDEIKAAALLAFSFEDFIKLLPTIYGQDAHFHPQMWLTRLQWSDHRIGRWPNIRVVRMEDSETLSEIPGIDLSHEANATGHIRTDFEWNDKTRDIIRSLYRDDFALGGYDA